MPDLQQNNSEIARPQGYILCGGKSKRFGSDKARFEIAGVPLIRRVANSLLTWTKNVTAIAEIPDKYADYQLKTIGDHQPNLGPLGGLQTALLASQQLQNSKQNSASDWILLTSCDMTALSATWLDTLWSCAKPTPNCLAVLFKEESQNRFHPFPGFYHQKLLTQVEENLRDKKLSFQKLILDLSSQAVTMEIPADWCSVPQINTLQDVKNWQSNIKE